MKIAQLIPTLNYGGVESYVTRISRALVELGEEVSIISEGGPIEERLAASGVDLIRVKLGVKDASSVAQLVKERGFDILNAQNYRAGRIAGPIAKLSGVPYVLTVHGPREFVKRVLVNYWSPRVITISAADKRGITGWVGGIAGDRVVTSFLPIDNTRYFPRPGVDSTVFPGCRELIVHVSRFSNRKARVSLELVDAFESIHERRPGARLLILGTGPMADRIAAKVADVNSRRGEIAVMNGPSLDVSDVFNSAAVVVATATTAMEAIACGTPVIAAGRTGYFGPVSVGNFDAAHDVLFADHGKCSQPAVAATLERAINGVLDDRAKWQADADGLARLMAEKFTPKCAAESLRRIYRQILEERRAG